MANDLHRAWFAQATPEPPPDGLTTLRHALVAMEAGLPLDAKTAKHLTAAFRGYLHDGKSDLTANLGLRPRQGGKCETPLRLERMNRRDTLIKQALQRLGGNKPHGRRMLAELLGADDLVLPSCFSFTEPVMALRDEAGGRLEISERQIARIASDKPAYRKKCRT